MCKIQVVRNTETLSEEMEGGINWKGINSTERERNDKLLNLLNSKLMQGTP